jgi:hypothetical protein
MSALSDSVSVSGSEGRIESVKAIETLAPKTTQHRKKYLYFHFSLSIEFFNTVAVENNTRQNRKTNIF